MSVEKDESSGPSLEKGITTPGDDRYHFDQSDLDRVQRRLKQRHLQMHVPLVCLCVQGWLTLTDIGRYFNPYDCVVLAYYSNEKPDEQRYPFVVVSQNESI